MIEQEKVGSAVVGPSADTIQQPLIKFQFYAQDIQQDCYNSVARFFIPHVNIDIFKYL